MNFELVKKTAFDALKTLVNLKLNTDKVVSNLTTTVAGNVLDATQGKALKDLLDSTRILATGKAFALTNAATGTTISHGYGTLLNLPTTGYALAATGLDAQGDEVTGIRAQKTTPDGCTLVFDDSPATLTGTIIIRVTPL